MTDRKFLVRFKPPELSPQLVIAEHAEFHGEHVVLLNSRGQCAALFCADVIESWSEFENDSIAQATRPAAGIGKSAH